MSAGGRAEEAANIRGRGPDAAAVAREAATPPPSPLPRYRLGLKEWCNARTRFLERPEVGEWWGEFFGTMLIVVFGVGVVNAALSGAHATMLDIALIWALGVALAIYTTAHISGAHLNPAITIAFALWRDFPPRKVPRYIAAQFAGGIAGGALNLGIFQGMRDVFERDNGITRGTPPSVQTAAAFGEYFPNPGHYGPYSSENNMSQEAANEVIYPGTALLVEAWGTFLLAFVIFAVTDPKNKAVGLTKALAPLLIGFVVGVNLALYAPITQAGWNPARDFGPRLVAALAGWQWVALPGPRNGFWIYIVGPIVGAVCGGGFYDVVLSRSLYPNCIDCGMGTNEECATAQEAKSMLDLAKFVGDGPARAEDGEAEETEDAHPSVAASADRGGASDVVCAGDNEASSCCQ